MADIEPCPACGALPCDWVDNPHAQSTTQKADNAALVEALTQAANNLAAAAKLYDCPGAFEAERLARAALQANTDGETGK